jgi:hypothetical protein
MKLEIFFYLNFIAWSIIFLSYVYVATNIEVDPPIFILLILLGCIVCYSTMWWIVKKAFNYEVLLMRKKVDKLLNSRFKSMGEKEDE